MQQDNWVDSMATKYSLQEEEIRYLRTIHQLFQTVEDVRMIDLAHCLHEGTGKVSYWIKKLREKGIIETDPKGFITLVQSNPGDMDENSDGRETQTIDISRSSLTLSDIKYLLAIQKLSQTQEIVRGTDLCQELGYSSAAVTNALKKLKDKNCIVVAANGAIIIGKSEDIKAINTLGLFQRVRAGQHVPGDLPAAVGIRRLLDHGGFVHHSYLRTDVWRGAQWRSGGVPGEGQGTCYPDGGCGILQKQPVHPRHGRRQGVPCLPGFCRARGDGGCLAARSAQCGCGPDGWAAAGLPTDADIDNNSGNEKSASRTQKPAIRG